MENNKPIGGKYSFDGDNRLAWKGDPEVPAVPTFKRSHYQQVCDFIEAFSRCRGLDRTQVPATKDAKNFGMGKASVWYTLVLRRCDTPTRNLCSTPVSPLLNLHRLLRNKLSKILKARYPFNSKEDSFVRYSAGEFMYQILEYTDGLRRIPQRQHLDEHPPFRLKPIYQSRTVVRSSMFLGIKPSTRRIWERSVGSILDSVVERDGRGFTHHIPDDGTGKHPNYWKSSP